MFCTHRRKTLQITPSIHAIRHSFRIPIAPGITFDRFVYSYLVYGDTIVLIDSGVAGCERRIFEDIRSTGRYTSEISLLVLTHSHPDHIGAARAIQQETGCGIAAHPAEREWIEDIDLQNRERPVPGFTTLVGGSVHVNHDLVEGDTIESGETGADEMLVLHTPGHSKGSISLLMQSERALFSGDAIPVAGDLPVYDDAALSVKSVKRLRKIADIRVLLSSWEDPRRKEAAYQKMDTALEYLRIIHEAVLTVNGEGVMDPVLLTKKAGEALGLPPQAITPLLARTFEANLRIRDHTNLLEDY